MTQEEKDLLLRDLCARLPYGVIINTGYGDLKLDRQHQNISIIYPEDCSKAFIERNGNSDNDFYITISGCYYGENVKPYLRPMSSMTEEEREEFESLGWRVDELENNEPWAHNGSINSIIKGVNWLNKNMFDYRGLIPMGLALEALEGMYKI